MTGKRGIRRSRRGFCAGQSAVRAIRLCDGQRVKHGVRARPRIVVAQWLCYSGLKKGAINTASLGGSSCLREERRVFSWSLRFKKRASGSISSYSEPARGFVRPMTKYDNIFVCFSLISLQFGNRQMMSKKKKRVISRYVISGTPSRASHL